MEKSKKKKNSTEQQNNHISVSKYLLKNTIFPFKTTMMHKFN